MKSGLGDAHLERQISVSPGSGGDMRDEERRWWWVSVQYWWGDHLSVCRGGGGLCKIHVMSGKVFGMHIQVNGVHNSTIVDLTAADHTDKTITNSARDVFCRPCRLLLLQQPPIHNVGGWRYSSILLSANSAHSLCQSINNYINNTSLGIRQPFCSPSIEGALLVESRARK